MTRNERVRQARKRDLALREHREKKLDRLERELHNQVAPSTEVSPFNEHKVRRSKRLAHNRRHKARRRGGDG
jgi:hypothetical protein